ncbi:MFS family permease [Sphingomonas vulcanisoli]|uniref:MFS family permease n=1 Tax=Sphingomonas vulcanisoli TaxID=1658060 RepID=A0ABX0TXV8_9SPHN|nr:MFS transporter [Sphingomonas vulcanisoli]NIJ09225.1 MFS family permease [Sphingomonas vulcanisoli]
MIRTPWYYGWNIVAIAVLYQSVIWGIGLSSFTYFVHDWMAAFHVGRAQIMIALSLEILLVGALAPLAGHLLDRLSTTMLVTFAVLCFGMGMFLISIATALWQIIVVYTLLLSVGMTLAGPLSATTLVVRWFRARRGLAMGFALLGSPLGAIAIPQLVTRWMVGDNWRGTHVYLGLICIALLPIVLLIVRGSPAVAGIEIEADSPRTAALEAKRPQQTWSIQQVIKTPAIWIIVCAFVPLSITNLGMSGNLAPFALDLGLTRPQVGALVPIIGALGFLAKLAFGSLSDRIDARILFYTSVVFVAAALIMMCQKPGFQMMMAACGIFGFGEGAALVLIGVMVAARFGSEAYGTAVGIVYFFVMTLAALGPIIGGYLRDVTGTYTAMCLVMLAMLFPAALAITLLRAPTRKARPPKLALNPNQ